MKKNEQVLEAWLQMTTVINNERITSDLPYNESMICRYLYQNQDKRNFINKFWGNKKMLTTFPNITITTKTGEIIRVKELLPEIKPYIYKFEGK